jgi:predicted site-specific integrase-resolvase
MVTRRDLYALADMIRKHNRESKMFRADDRFTPRQLKLLAAFCASQNPIFDREVWVRYIAGKCEPPTNDVVEAMVEIIDGQVVFSRATSLSESTEE